MAAKSKSGAQFELRERNLPPFASPPSTYSSSPDPFPTQSQQCVRYFCDVRLRPVQTVNFCERALPHRKLRYRPIGRVILRACTICACLYEWRVL